MSGSVSIVTAPS